MKTLYFDCSWGISEGMILGALIDVSGLGEYLVRELEKIKADGHQIIFSKKLNHGVSGTLVSVRSDRTELCFKDAFRLITESTFEDNVKRLSGNILRRILEAEKKVLAIDSDDLGRQKELSFETILKIVGTAILIDRICPERILSGTLNDGYGFIENDHEMISIPDPVTSEIIAEGRMKLGQIDKNIEMITPAGAAILAELAENYGPLPAMSVEKAGRGIDTWNRPVPAMLKVFLGNVEETSENFIIMETNIDDCSGEILGYTMELLMARGALDVFYTPVFMKKNRPAYLLTVACREADMEMLQDIIFRETTSIGIRYRSEWRIRLDRRSINCDTPYGRIKAKKVRLGDDCYIYPEYESLREMALSSGIPLKMLYRMDLDQLKE